MERERKRLSAATAEMERQKLKAVAAEMDKNRVREALHPNIVHNPIHKEYDKIMSTNPILYEPKGRQECYKTWEG